MKKQSFEAVDEDLDAQEPCVLLAERKIMQPHGKQYERSSKIYTPDYHLT